jgi:hypothetical protein
MRTDHLPQAIAAASRIPFSPDLRLGITPVREAGSVAPGLSAPPAAQAAGGSSLLAGHGSRAPSPGMGVICARKSDRGVLPDPHTASRIDQIGAYVCIVLVLACALLGGDVWIARLLIAWGLA